jgi:hypothetical protein
MMEGSCHEARLCCGCGNAAHCDYCARGGFAVVTAIARQRVETADFRATGRLVRVYASGNRTNNAITIKARWFPGVLRSLVGIVPPQAGNARQDTRVNILLEMRPNGQNTIRILRSHEPAAASLPFDKLSESVFGSRSTKANLSKRDFSPEQISQFEDRP